MKILGLRYSWRNLILICIWTVCACVEKLCTHKLNAFHTSLEKSNIILIIWQVPSIWFYNTGFFRVKISLYFFFLYGLYRVFYSLKRKCKHQGLNSLPWAENLCAATFAAQLNLVVALWRLTVLWKWLMCLFGIKPREELLGDIHCWCRCSISQVLDLCLFFNPQTYTKLIVFTCSSELSHWCGLMSSNAWKLHCHILVKMAIKSIFIFKLHRFSHKRLYIFTAWLNIKCINYNSHSASGGFW